MSAPAAADLSDQAHTDQGEPDLDVVVVGAGMAGLYLLYRLRAMGLSAVLPKQLCIDTEIVIAVTAPMVSETHLSVGEGGPPVTITGDLGQITGWLCGRSEPGGGEIAGDRAAVGSVRAGLALTP